MGKCEIKFRVNYDPRGATGLKPEKGERKGGKGEIVFEYVIPVLLKDAAPSGPFMISCT